MITIDSAVSNLTSKYSKYNVDSFTIRKSIEHNVQRGLSTEQAINVADSTLYKAYVMRRA
jgi:hypothetical protein